MFYTLTITKHIYTTGVREYEQDCISGVIGSSVEVDLESNSTPQMHCHTNEKNTPKPPVNHQSTIPDVVSVGHRNYNNKIDDKDENDHKMNSYNNTNRSSSNVHFNIPAVLQITNNTTNNTNNTNICSTGNTVIVPDAQKLFNFNCHTINHNINSKQHGHQTEQMQMQWELASMNARANGLIPNLFGASNGNINRHDYNM